MRVKHGTGNLKFPLTLPLSPAFAEAASRRQANGEREGVRGERKG